MTAQIGADGHELFGDPRPEWLTEVTRLEPEPRRDWVNLEEHPGFQSTQRLWIGDPADASGVLVATWPAELQSQARYLYCRGLGSDLVAAAHKRGWTVEPSPHLAYWRAPSSRRLYMCPSVEPPDYVACWEDKDALRWVRSYTRDEVEDELWQWLKERRFADNGDNAELRRFLDECLPRKQRVHMRPGLRFRRVWKHVQVAELGAALAETIRNDFDAVFAVAVEPALGSAGPGGRPTPRHRNDRSGR
jgi:hypothetical protein